MKSRFDGVDEGSYLASVSDLMSGLMFIFIIVIVVFALGLKDQEIKKEDEVRRLRGAAEERARLLERIKRDLTKAGIQVSIAPDQGVLRLGEGILFALGRADLDGQGQTTVVKLAQVLGEVLPCYTVTPPQAARPDCGPSGSAGRLDALFIEGHTDNLQISGLRPFKDNWELSTARAKTIFTSLVATNPLLDELRNQDSQSVLSLSGYAERRKIADNDTEDGRKLNRRIDLRFVMVPPNDLLPPPAAQVKERMGL